jgi:hypothetical protein
VPLLGFDKDAAFDRGIQNEKRRDHRHDEQRAEQQFSETPDGHRGFSPNTCRYPNLPKEKIVSGVCGSGLLTEWPKRGQHKGSLF